jgi:glycosyltransferase involved in cell wall biosynthesis
MSRNSSQPLVSVLITSYNREKYIAAAIESVLASTYKNFELIIVDDGSKDSTVSIAQKYAAEDNRISVYINERNLGDYPNRNKAASYAKGKYIKYVDADDYIYPWGLACLVDMMEQFPGAGWGLCSLHQFTGKPFPFQLSPEEAYLYHYEGPGLFHKAPLSSIIKKEVFDAVGGFNPIRMAGDFDMWHRLARAYPVVLMPHGMVWYRSHGEQEVNSYRNYLGVYENLKIGHLRHKEMPLGPERGENLVRREKKKILKELSRTLITLNLAGFRDSLKRIGPYYRRSRHEP